MKKILTAISLVAVLLVGVAQLTTVNASAKVEPTDIQKLERAAITIMQPSIKSAINTFYGQHLNQLLETNIQDTEIIDVTAYNGSVFFDVTIETKPFIVENVPIGQDKISLFVNVFGLVTAEKFEHQKNIDLPSNYMDKILKPLPEKTIVNLPKRTHVDSDIEATPDNEMTKVQKLDALLRVLVMSEVQNAVNVFYAPYLKYPPQMNSYYGYEIVKLASDKDNPKGYTLIVTITPYEGAHNSIGKEKITMSIWENGTVLVRDYEHLINYGIVPWLKGSLKKPLPEGTQKK